MKKLWIAACALLLNTAYALPVDNPAEASLFNCEDLCHETSWCGYFNLGIGYYGDYVFNRHLETVNGKDIDTTKIFTNAAYIALDFYEHLEVFATLGASRLSLNTSLGAFNAVDPLPLFEVESQTAFSYSIGAKATLFKFRCISIGAEGRYFVTVPNIKRMYIAAGAVSYPGDELKTRYSEWQVAAGISYCYNEFFIPFAAIKYAHSYWKFDNGNLFIIDANDGTYLYNMRTQRHWGYAIGLTFFPPACDRFFVTVEARFPDEKALYINGQMLF